jgi:hypothetical protein
MIELRALELSQIILDILDGQGLVYQANYAKPTPILPEDITKISDEELMDLFSSFTEYGAFLMMQIAAARIDEESREKALETYEAKFIAEAPKGETVAKTKALIMLEADYKGHRLSADVARHYRSLVEGIQKGNDDSRSVTSREITRRKNEMF